MVDWIKVSEQLPIEESVVETKIDDSKGCRNVQKLKCRGSYGSFLMEVCTFTTRLRIGGSHTADFLSREVRK